MPNLTPTDFTPDEMARFWAKVDRGAPDECWEWRAAHNEHGYGVVRVKGRLSKAHRVVLSLAGQDVPESAVVMHACDNPPCVNPSHLRVGSQQENIADMHRKGRRSYPARTPKPLGPPRPPAGRYTYATACVRGHAFTPENTYMKPNVAVSTGYERVCITCRKARNKAQAARRKAARQQKRETA